MFQPLFFYHLKKTHQRITQQLIIIKNKIGFIPNTSPASNCNLVNKLLTDRATARPACLSVNNTLQQEVFRDFLLLGTKPTCLQ